MSVQGIRSGENGGCYPDYVYFGDVPSGSGEVRAAFLSEVPSISAVSIKIATWKGTLSPPCELNVEYKTKLGSVGASCEREGECADLLKHSFDLATAVDHAGRALLQNAGPFTRLTGDQPFPDNDLPNEAGWFTSDMAPNGTYRHFSNDDSEPAYKLNGSDLVYRIGHGIERDYRSDGYIVGVYKRASPFFKAIAGFEIPKARVGLANEVQVNDIADPIDPSRLQ